MDFMNEIDNEECMQMNNKDYAALTNAFSWWSTLFTDNSQIKHYSSDGKVATSILQLKQRTGGIVP